MNPESCYRFVLLDFGHPMNPNSINNIIKSLENTLTLGLAFPQNAEEIIFGITVLNSDIAIFGLQSELWRNYNSIIKNLKAALKTKMSSSRVTIQEYRHLLRNSIEVVFHELQKLQKSHNIYSESDHRKIQIAVVTGKTASVLADILTDVTSKLQRINPLVSSVKKFKAVQILNADEEIRKDTGENNLIDWMSCSHTVYSLNCFFKEWLLNRQQQLRILLSNDLNLEIKCDVEDCLVNPFPMIFDGRFDLLNDIRSKGIQKPGFDLEVIHRLPVNGLCPTFVYGIPRRIFPTGLESSIIESEVNSKIFKELCQRLYQTGEGLLAKLVLTTEKNELKTFHFLTSDGVILLMNDVAPEELYLPTRIKLPKVTDSQKNESAASVIETCFEKINLLDEYNPKCFSSGVYDRLKDYLGKAGQSRSLFGMDPEVKLFGKNCGKKKTDSKRGLGIKNCTDDNKASNECENLKKKPKKSSGAEPEHIHPALLSPDVVEKYRKIHSTAFNIPELSEDYV